MKLAHKNVFLWSFKQLSRLIIHYANYKENFTSQQKHVNPSPWLQFNRIRDFFKSLIQLNQSLENLKLLKIIFSQWGNTNSY